MPIGKKGRIGIVLMAIACSLFVVYNSKSEVKPAIELTKEQQFEKDSLHFETLIQKGNELYSQRNQMNNVKASLVYFDSALLIATKTANVQLLAKGHYFIGNVYNAWNKKPEKTVYHYSASLQNIKKSNSPMQQYYLVSYVLAHANDNEKLGDSTRCIAILNEVYERLNQLPDSLKQKIEVIPDYAWVASNCNNYSLAEQFLTKHTKYPVKNNPRTNNYRDHYYITKARIDIQGKKLPNSPFLDSIERAVKECSNNFDRQYYLEQLVKLYLPIGEYKKAFEAREKTIALSTEINQGEITSLVKANALLNKLRASDLKREQTSKQLNNAYLLILMILLFVALLFFVIRLRQRQRIKKQAEKERNMRSQFTKQLFETIESDRKRIASDLHDSIGNELITLKRTASDEQVELKEKIDFLMETIRSISRNLHPALFERIGLKITVEQLVERIQYLENFLITAEIDYSKGLDSSSELQVYRIIQEALTNMLKHSNAVAGKLVIEEKALSVDIEIKDNGKGFNVEETLQNPKAFGIHNIIERVNAINGTIDYTSTEQGTFIFISIPKFKS